VLGSVMAVAAHATADKSARLYEDALARSEKNDFKGAVIQLKNALKEDNKNLPAHVLYGRLLLKSGELKAAEAAFEGALQQGVGKSEVVADLGQVYLQLGEVRKLLDTITAAGLPPALQCDVLILRGSALLMSNNPTGAAQAFAEARAQDPNSALPNIAEAPMLLRAGEGDKAKAMALKATEMAPQNANAWQLLGSILFSGGDLPAALAAYDKAITLSPKHVDSRVSRASVLFSLKRWPEATAELKVLKDAQVQEPRASFLRARLASERGDAKAAQVSFTETANMIDAMSAVVRNNSEPLLLVGALAHRALGHGEKTREYLAALLSRNPRHVASQTLMATTLLEANEFNKAVPYLEGLLRINPNDAQALYMMGSVYLARKQYPQATDYLDRAAKAGSGSAALRDLSFSQFGLGQDKTALANLERAYAQNPKDYRAGIELAVFYARAGDAAKAVAIADALVKLDPGNLTMLNFLGNVKGRLGDKKGLRAAYEQALAKDPNFRPVVMNMSWLDMQEGRMDEARARLKAFLKVQPKDPDVLFQLGLLEQGAKRNAAAVALWTEADRVQQKDPRPGLALLELQFAERKTEAALASAKALAARYPDVLQVQTSLARAQMMAGDPKAARQTLQDATVKAGFDPESLVTVGRLQLQAGNAEGASYAATKALQSSPNDLMALALQVEVAGKRGNPTDVDKALATLQARYPNHPVTQTLAGHIAFSRGQLPKAIGLYKGVFEREPSTALALTLVQAYMVNKEPEKALALLEGWSKKQDRDISALRALAELQFFNGKTEAARNNYEAVLKADPNDASVLAGYAKALLRLNDPAALAMAEKAFKSAPGNTAVADLYGWALVQKGDMDAGLRVLRDVRLREPGNATVRWHLAWALAKSGRKVEAREELRAALGATPPPPPAAEIDRLKAELGV
jgi:putative PEP-CTERM system TPR-repeat lipoprotein